MPIKKCDCGSIALTETHSSNEQFAENKKINYKLECLKIHPKLKASKVNGTAFYHIITGNQMCHTTYSGFCDTITEAWKNCYLKLKG